jgi:sRNA-binding carbon storage regulator CsrA
MSLVLTRRPGEGLLLLLSPDADHDEVLKKLCTSGVEVRINSVDRNNVKIGIDAPEDVLVLRNELVGRL